MRSYGPASRHLRRVLKASMERLPAPYSVLDVGCGQGDLLRDVLGIFPDTEVVCGVDISEAGMATAKRRIGRGEFQALDISQGALSEQFDLVLCTDVIEHIIDDVAAFRNLAQMTAGHLILTTVEGRMRPIETEVGHVRNYARGELAAKAKLAGLKEVHRFDWGFPFYSPLYRDFLNIIGGKGTTGQFGPGRRFVAEALYQLFRLNSWHKGEYVVVTFAPDK